MDSEPLIAGSSGEPNAGVGHSADGDIKTMSADTQLAGGTSLQGPQKRRADLSFEAIELAGQGYDGDSFASAELKALLTALHDDKVSRTTTKKIVVGGIDTGKAVSEATLGLAVTCADLGFNVLLVDARAEECGRTEHFQGLSDLLMEKSAPHKYPRPTRTPNLALLTAGTEARRFPSLLARERVFHRLQPIDRFFDYIIVDAAFSPVQSLARLSVDADHLILGVAEHRSSLNSLEVALGVLQCEMVPRPEILILK